MRSTAGIQAAPTRPDLYLQATAFLLKHKLSHEVWVSRTESFPPLPMPRAAVAQAVTLELAVCVVSTPKNCWLKCRPAGRSGTVPH